MQTYIRPTLVNRIKGHYSIYMFRATARLDVPTFNDNGVQDKLQKAASGGTRSTVAWDAIQSIVGVFGTLTSLISQTFVLVQVVRGQPDGPLLALVACLPHFTRFLSTFQHTTFDGGTFFEFELNGMY